MPATYRTRRDDFRREHDELTRRWNRVANLRLLAFLVAAAGLGSGLRSGTPFLLIGAALLFVAFVVLVRRHRALGRQRRRAAILYDLNVEAEQRRQRAWHDLPLRHSFRSAPEHPFAADLDLFGRASVFQLLETVTTPIGEATLRRWLLAPAPLGTIRERQAAVAELAPLLDWRQSLAVHGRLIGTPPPDPEPFLRWAEGDRLLGHRRSLVRLARASVVVLVVTAVANASGLIGLPLWIAVLAFNLLLSQTAGRGAGERVAAAASQHGAFVHYGDLLAHVDAVQFAAPLLGRLQDQLVVDGRPAYEHVRRLSRLTALVVPPSSIVYLIIQAIALWDIHVLDALERWQVVAGRRARGWLATIGEIEALGALSTLEHDNPHWAFPEVDPAAAMLVARDLGHPLLAGDVRVVNDVEVGPAGTFLLVTGSNMSGKSTLLRALGVNIVLAGAGGPVCATALRLSPVSLWTSVRVQDSLERGVSFFMAELQRLKQIVDAADAAGPDDPRRFFLLDEILQGTNTAERQIAARRIIRTLVDRGAIGAVSTHDLTLAEEAALGDVARPIHFSETIADGPGGPAMSFDYKVRPGLATTTNALRLMELVGFDLDGVGDAKTDTPAAGRPVEDARLAGDS